MVLGFACLPEAPKVVSYFCFRSVGAKGFLRVVPWERCCCVWCPNKGGCRASSRCL